jgi:hypothetical protein
MEAALIRPVLLSALVVVSGSALAQAEEVTDTAFELGLTPPGGETTYTATTAIPYLPGEACYYWYVQLSKPKGDISFVEVMTLPGAPTNWGDLGPDDGVTVADDGMSVTREATQTPTDGWISNGWCLVEGDPSGQHHIDVTIGEQVVGSFDFEVLPPEDETPPDLPPDLDTTGEDGPPPIKDKG